MLGAEIRTAAARVLTDPRRAAFLLDGGPRNAVELTRFLSRVLPLARGQLQELRAVAGEIPDKTLRGLALFTLRQKGYHVAGGCILATFLRSGTRERYVRLVAPLESIYDYLDSLCDRHPQTAEAAVPRLHRALMEALNGSLPLSDYYADGPPGSDGGYLRCLVERVRLELERLCIDEALQARLRESSQLYAQHQLLKHFPEHSRQEAIERWHQSDGARSRDLTAWEFAAAAGSQLQVYAPLFAIAAGDEREAAAAYDAYFPHLAALHVLLDSFIDQAEDDRHGELNWVRCYASPAEFVERAAFLARSARERFRSLRKPSIHDFALRVLVLFYLSHPKVRRQHLERQSAALLRALA